MKKLIYLFLLFLLNPLFGQEYIQVTSSEVNIREKASSSSTLVGQSDNGRIFEFKGEESGWYKVLIITSEYRYIDSSFCKKVDYSLTLPSESVLKSIFKNLIIAEDSAVAEAGKKYPNDKMKNYVYKRILEDRYMLNAFIKLDLNPTIYPFVIKKGVKERWHLPR